MTTTEHDNLEEVLGVTAAMIGEPIAGTETSPIDVTNQEAAETNLLQNYQEGNIVMSQTEGISSENNMKQVSVEDAERQNSVGLAEDIMNVFNDTNAALDPEEAIAKLHNCPEEPEVLLQELDSLEQLAVERVREIEGELINGAKRRPEALETNEQESKRMKMVEESIMKAVLAGEQHTSSKYTDETSKLIETLSGDLVCSNASLNKDCSTHGVFEDISDDEKFGKEIPSLSTPVPEAVSATNNVLSSEHCELSDTNLNVQNLHSENVSMMADVSVDENLNQDIHDLAEKNHNFEPCIESHAESSVSLSSEKTCEEINREGTESINDNGTASVTITTELPPSEVSFSSSSDHTATLDNFEQRNWDNSESCEQVTGKTCRSKTRIGMLNTSGDIVPVKETSVKISEKENAVLSTHRETDPAQERVSSTTPTIILSKSRFLDALKSGLCQIVSDPGGTESKFAVVTSDAFQEELWTEIKDQRSTKPKTKESFSSFKEVRYTKDNMDNSDPRHSKSNTKQSSSSKEVKFQSTEQNANRQSTPAQNKCVEPNIGQMKSWLESTYKQPEIVSKSDIENVGVLLEKSSEKTALKDNMSSAINEEADEEYALAPCDADIRLGTNMIGQSSHDNSATPKTYESRDGATVVTSSENQMESHPIHRDVTSRTVHPDKETYTSTLQHLHKKITYNDLKTRAKLVNLPSTLWSFQVESNGNFVVFLRMSVNLFENTTIDKAVMFEKSLEPQVFLSGKPVALPVPPVENISDIIEIISDVDKLAFCEGTGIKQRPNSKYCYGYLDVSNPGNRCSQCIEERRRVLLLHQQKLKERLSKLEEDNSG